jgi:uncharacterized protein (TIGR02757 family)
MNLRDLERLRLYAERAYCRFHHPRYVPPDPLELVLPVREQPEREIVALVASSFALGRVGSIVAIVGSILGRLSAAAGGVLEGVTGLGFDDLLKLFEGMVYRFFTATEIASFLSAAGTVIREYGSLEGCFAAGLDPGEATVLPALEKFSWTLRGHMPEPCGILVTDPAKGASKRLHLFLRWMVRRDAVDPGGWSAVPASKLIVPMDTHMLRISRLLGITNRKTADIRTALEVTETFRCIQPEDPVRYDFALTRYGIHPEGRAEAAALLTGNGQSGERPTTPRAAP